MQQFYIVRVIVRDVVIPKSEALEAPVESIYIAKSLLRLLNRMK